MRAVLLTSILALTACVPSKSAPTSTSARTPIATDAILHAHVWTGDAKRPWAEAVAWKDDRIVVVGSDQEVSGSLAPGVTPIDAHGAFVAPGFVDAHLHFVESGAMLASVQLRDVTSKDEFVARVAAFARTMPAGEWMLGGDWDHTRWGGALPDKTWLDAATGDRPAWLNRLDGHMALASSAAMRAAGIGKDTKDVAGGTIVRDADGEPTGIFKDNALALVDKAVPPMTPEMQDRAVLAAMKYVAARGMTSVESMGTGWDDLAAYRRAHDAGRMTARIYAVVPLADWSRLVDEIGQHGRGDAWLRIGGLKGFADGSLGAHTALMLAPYADAPNDTGLVVTPKEVLYDRVSHADAAGLQVMIHAIGDRANRDVLDVYERVAKEHGPKDRRFRIEHAQHLTPEDVPRFGQLGVIASMQPYHCIDDGRWAEPLIGHERAKTSYAYRALLDAHAVIAFGSDWHVAPATPLEGIYAAVTRRTLDDRNPGGWIPEQKMTVDEALRAYTWAGAYASFEENDKGTLSPGKLADLVEIDHDLTRIPPETIRDARVLRTIVGGKTVYEATP